MIIALFIFTLWSISQISSISKQSDRPTLNAHWSILTSTVTFQVTQDTSGTSSIPTAISNNENQSLAPLQKTNEAIQTNPTQSFSGSDPLQVYIVARQRAWMKVISDGKEAFIGRVITGNAYPFSANQQIEIQCGNAAALQIVFNQQDLGNLGNIGQPINLIFTMSGIITPTARFTYTPTATPLATLTPQPTPTVKVPTLTPFIP